MKRKKMLLGIMCMISLMMSAQQRMEITPKLLHEGEEVTLTYNPHMTVLKGNDDIKGVLYYWKDYYWEASDMQLRKDGNSLVYSFKVPEGCALLAWKYYTSDTVDVGNNAWDYASYVLTKKDKSMPSANIGWGMLRGEHTQQLLGIPTMQDVKFEKKNDEVVRMWINYELRDHPEQLKNVFWYASKLMASDTTAIMKEKLTKNLKLVLDMDSKEKYDENFLLKALDVAQNIIGNKQISDDIKTRIAKRYPNGEYFREIEAKELFMKADKTKQREDFEAYIKKFPPQNFTNSFVLDDMFSHWYDNLLRAYVYTPIMKQNDYSHVTESFNISPLVSLTTYFWHIIQIPYERGDVSAERLYPIAVKLRNAIMSKPRTHEELAYSPAEWKDKLYKDYRFAWLDYAKLINDVGQYKEAMALVDTLATYYGTKDADFNTFRVKMLDKTGRTAEILPIIKSGMFNNAASPDMLAFLKANYVKQHGSEAGYDDYEKSLKSADLVEKQREMTLKELIQTPVQMFSMEKMQGGQLDMNSYKGKIIVIDFWATWCGPCKAAMPGMQMAVEKYKNDSDVKFLFVATMETSKNYKDNIRKFIKEKGYNFQVCFDAMDKGGKPQKVYGNYSALFHSSGIPMKMIIDQNGNARWFSNGYFGSPTALVDELSTIIDYLKTNK